MPVSIAMLSISSKAFLFLQAKFFGKFSKIANLHPFEGATTPELVKLAHARGWRVFVWTVNTRDNIARMVEAGVDGIITDDPMLCREVMDGI